MFWFFRKKPKQDPQRYKREREIASGGNVGERLSLARNHRTHQEILYYLAEKDPDAAVRRAVAENKTTPLHASPILAADKSEDVRMALAGRLVTLLPELSHDRHSQLYAYAVQALATLALDEVLKIRKALASTLKDHAQAPPKVAAQLAKDIEREVSEPILRFCVALADDDLLAILKEHPAGWAVEAVAARPQVSAPVSEAVIDTGHAPAGAILIGNEGAVIPQVLLEHIIDRAREYPEWHEPLAGRKNLPPAMARKLAEFVDDKVRGLLLARGDFDEKTTAEIASAVRRRIDFEGGQPLHNPAAERVKALVQEGRMNEEALSDALAMRDREFVIAALAHMAHVKPSDVARIFAMKAPRPICALAWKAKLSMRTAFRLQQEIGLVPAKELLYPKGGTDYPLTEEELRWQLEFLGLEAA